MFSAYFFEAPVAQNIHTNVLTPAYTALCFSLVFHHAHNKKILTFTININGKIDGFLHSWENEEIFTTKRRATCSSTWISRNRRAHFVYSLWLSSLWMGGFFFTCSSLYYTQVCFALFLVLATFPNQLIYFLSFLVGGRFLRLDDIFLGLFICLRRACGQKYMHLIEGRNGWILFYTLMKMNMMGLRKRVFLRIEEVEEAQGCIERRRIGGGETRGSYLV